MAGWCDWHLGTWAPGTWLVCLAPGHLAPGHIISGNQKFHLDPCLCPSSQASKIAMITWTFSMVDNNNPDHIYCPQSWSEMDILNVDRSPQIPLPLDS